jgi:surfeit locus 1 family protein
MARSIVSAGIATGAATAILVSLGVWQIQRLHWKQGLLARIAAAEAAPPAALLPGETPNLFARVLAHGVLRGNRAALYGAEVRGDHMGAQLVEILDRAGQKPLLVVLGWVPTDRGRPAPITGPRDITGYVRLPEHANFLSAPDDFEGLRFYTLNPAAIATALGAPDAAPFTLVALKNPSVALPPPDAPEAAEALPRPPNNHLQYALTWFGLAAALLGVFGAWALKKV